MKVELDAARRVGVVLVVSALAFLLSRSLDRLFDLVPSAPFFAAVAISTWYADLTGGVLATVVCGLLMASIFLIPTPPDILDLPGTMVRLSGFALAGGLIVWLSHAMQSAQRRAVTSAVARNHALSEARDALRTRDEFLAAISHDLRTPLTIIKGLAQLVKHELARESTPNLGLVLGRLQQIDGTVNKMQAQIDELTDLAHSLSGQELALNRRLTDLVALVHDIVTANQQTTTLHTLRVESLEPTAFALVDPGRLERVLNNLIGNAIKYSPDGGDVIVTVGHGGQRDTKWAEIRVTDHGLGIPAEDVPRIFERFNRARNVVGRISGSGIGLASSLQIVHQHRGTMTVHSVEGVGSTFTVRLPLPGLPDVPMGAPIATDSHRVSVSCP